jgi:uncharacterized membrane protein YphA (DoxX/SURF4 family)
MDRMKEFAIKAGQLFFGIALIGFSVQQFMYGVFRPIIIPSWPHWIPGEIYYEYTASILMIVMGIGIVFFKKPRNLLIFLGIFILLIFTLIQLPYRFLADLHNLGEWTNTFKALASAGGAFILAAALPNGNSHTNRSLNSLMLPLGKVFFSVFLIFCGIEHFIYTDFVASLVPSWIPWHRFWTFFAAIALIGAGLAIILGISRRQIAILLGIMLFLWLIILHIPRAIADPASGNGNEWSSVFEALAFSGFAFVLAVLPEKRFGRNHNVPQ